KDWPSQPRCGIRAPDPYRGGLLMRFYTTEHRFYCGVDLHARTLSACVLDAKGQVVWQGQLAAHPEDFLGAIAPYRDGLVVACECMSAWYWLADLCALQGIPFVLGHALYMKAIHGGKAKNDRIDAAKIARLLRGGNLPQAYVYPAGMRATRDLLRRRTFLVRRAVGPPSHHQQPVQSPAADAEAVLRHEPGRDQSTGPLRRSVGAAKRRHRPGADRRLRFADSRTGTLSDAHRQGR